MESTRSLRAGAGLLALGLLVLSTGARAEPFVFRRAVPLGHPPKPATVVVAQREQAVVLEVDRAHAELPISAPQRVDVQAVALAGGAALAVVRVSGGEGREAAALLSRGAHGRAEILWVGALGLHGDPGERSAAAIELTDQTGDGQPDVVVGELSERARICGQTPALLYPRAVDPASLQLRPVTLARAPLSQPPTAERDASPQTPGPSVPPLVRALRVSAVSSQPGMEAQPALASPSNALTDGDLATFWTTDNRAGDRGEFATLQWGGDALAIRALALVPVPAGIAADRAVSIARVLWLIGDDGTRIKVRVPDAPLAGQRYWIALDKPLNAHCLSVVIADAAPLHAGRPGPAVIAEVEAYTDLDFGGGFDRLVQDLSEAGARAGEAEHLLASAGAAALPTLRDAWPKLSASARRRAARVLAKLAEAAPAARETLALALDDADADVRAAAFAALLTAGPHSRELLAPRIADAGEQSDAAAIALARQAPREAIAPLLAALAKPGGSERPALREAIALVCENAGEDVSSAVRAWTGANGDNLPARAGLALALAKSAEAFRPIAAELLAADAPRATRFEDIWRLVQAARALPSDAAVDAWLAALAKDDTRWMLRVAAIEALAERNAPQRSTSAKAAIEDEYPRVRASAAAALASDADARDALALHAARDQWALVRIAALDALAGRSGNEALLRKGVGDRSRRVRAAAVRALTKVGDAGAWPVVVEQRLQDQDEWPEVVAEAIRFAQTLCVQAAVPQLQVVLQRGLKPDAWSPDADNALLAFDALLHLGGNAAKSAIEAASAPISPQAFKTAARTQRTKTPTCAATP